MKKLNLKGLNILVTAGSTWVPLDEVRVITNIFSGALGVKIAREAALLGARTTLLLGTGWQGTNFHQRNLTVSRYKYFKELNKLMISELKKKKYDVVIHSAAVSDYEPMHVQKGKVKSGKNDLTIKFKPTIKLVDLVRKIEPAVFLVKFKLEVGKKKQELLKIAYKSMLKSRANLIVANDFKSISKKEHNAFIINQTGEHIVCKSKDAVSRELLNIIHKNIPFK